MEHNYPSVSNEELESFFKNMNFCYWPDEPHTFWYWNYDSEVELTTFYWLQKETAAYQEAISIFKALESIGEPPTPTRLMVEHLDIKLTLEAFFIEQKECNFSKLFPYWLFDEV